MKRLPNIINGSLAIAKGQSREGFTLVEVLVVLAIIAIASVASLVAVQQLQETGNLNRAIGDIAFSLQTARAYAMANHTHVFMGITEVQQNGSSTGTGRVILAMAATVDGTSDYDASNVGATWTAATSPGSLAAVRPLQAFNNLHLANFTALSASTGPMATRESPAISLAGTPSLTPFSWPLNNASASASYTFNEVVEFQPNGTAVVQTESGGSLQVVELDLQPAHGSIAPLAPQNVTVGNIAAIQVDGITGAVTTYQP